MLLTDRKVLVVGGSRGIGRAICIKFAQAGADIALIYRSREAEAQDVCQEISSLGRKAVALRADMSNFQENIEAVRAAAEELGGLDVLVNSVGIFPKQSIIEIQPQAWTKLINTNLSSYFFSIQAALPYLRNSATGGKVINLSSQAAMTGSVNGSHYCAAKAGVLGLTYALAKELGPTGITVNALVPGRINTEMIGYADEKRREEWLAETPLGRFGEAMDVASAALFLASDGGNYITGAKINICGGILMG